MWKILAGLGLVACLAARPLAACDSSVCLLVTRSENGLVARGVLKLDLSFRSTDQSLLLEGSRRVDRVLRPEVSFESRRLRPGYHDELGGNARFLQLDAAYGVTSRLTALLSLPVFRQSSFDIGHPPVLSENYTTRGNGDALVGLRYGARLGRGRLAAGASLELPTGRYDLESPPGFADQGILDPMLQPGSGSWDVVGAAQYSFRWPPATAVDWTLAASYQLNTSNDLEYRLGDTTIVSATASRSLGPSLSASLQIKGVFQGRSRYLEEGVPSTGSTTAYLTPGLSFSATRSASLYVFVPVPIYRYVNEAQLAPRPSLVLGVSRSFSF